jgi:hypothetical protein
MKLIPIFALWENVPANDEVRDVDPKHRSGILRLLLNDDSKRKAKSKSKKQSKSKSQSQNHKFKFKFSRKLLPYGLGCF